MENKVRLRTDITDIYKNKTVLITGGTGFIGSALTKTLIEIDCKLIILSSSSNAWAPEVSCAEISLLSGDVSDPKIWKTILGNVDYIFHLAAVEGISNIRHEVETNAISMLNLLDVCSCEGFFPKIIYSSSVNIFGNVSLLPVNENFCDNPVSIWSAHKLLAEQYLRAYYYNYGINSVSLRLSNVYGVAPNKNAVIRPVINRIIYMALNREILKLYSNRNCVRDYVFIDDVVNAFLLAGGIAVDECQGQSYIIGSQEGITISDAWKMIAEKVSNRIGQKIVIENDESVKLETMEMRNFVSDTSFFSNATGWNSFVTFEEGVELTMDALGECV